jgi:uncharacterized membrane protein YjgN (DUF898 family)
MADAAHRVRFEGSAAAYARLWFTNLLLSLLTVGLYTPLARRRTLRYLRGHTRLAGSALEWHPAPPRAVFGFALLLAGYVAFKMAAGLHEDQVAIALLLAGTLVAPSAWAAGVRVRVASTAWRGWRPRFEAGWREVYRTSAPLFGIALAWAAVLTIGNWASALPAAVASLAFALQLEFRSRQLLFARTRVGEHPVRWDGRLADVLRIWQGAAGVFLFTAALLAPWLALGWLAWHERLPTLQQVEQGVVPARVAIAFGLGWFLIAELLSTPARAWREAAVFRLMWNDVRVGELARFTCDLQPRAYALLRTRNLLLSLATLGLYHPVAAIAAYRMKAQSVTLHAHESLE